MDTRDQALTKLTRSHNESHPTPHRLVSLQKELLTRGDGDVLVMMKIKDPPLRSPKGTPDLASR